MNKLTQRLLLFFLGTPLLVAIITQLPMFHHLAWNVVMILGSIAGASELNKILFRKLNIKLRKIPLAGAYLPVAAYLELSNLVFSGFTSFILIIILSIIMTREVFLNKQEDIQNVIFRLFASVLKFIYPGIFMVYAVRISIFPDSSYLILLFLILIFTNDSMAFVGGTLFGRKSKKIFLVSPNKSLVGFVVGIVFTAVAGLLFKIIFSIPVSYWQMLILSISCAIVANVGDLIESAIKRSADIKDSGNLMPGRGGILDSIDSMLFSAPVYYYILAVVFR